MPHSSQPGGPAGAAQVHKPRLWVVSELYFPEQTSTGYFLTRIAEGLTSDYDVHVIAGQPSYSERGMRAPRREKRHGATINRMRSSHFDKDRLVLRAINLVTFTFAVLGFALLRFRRGDKVLVVTNPPTVPLIVGILAKMRGCPAVLLVHDVYPEFLVALGALRQASALNALLEHLFAWTYRSFDRIVVLGRDMKDVVSLKLGEGDRVRIIPNWADVDEIRPVPREENSFRAALGLGDSFVVQFSGNIGRSHDVELLLETAQLLVDAREIKFLFVGYGGKSGLISAAKDKRCQNVLFLPRQPREKLAEMLSASDATAILFVEGMYGLSVPSRMYNVMAAGVPIIAVAHPQSELAQTVQESNCGWVLKARSAESMAALLRNLASEEGLAEAQMRGHAGRKLVCRRYTLEHVLDQYRKLFSGI